MAAPRRQPRHDALAVRRLECPGKVLAHIRGSGIGSGLRLGFGLCLKVCAFGW
jgi:hypothetical protein